MGRSSPGRNSSESSARSLELADGTSAPTPDQLAALRHTVLQAGVDRLLFVQEAAKRGLEIPPAEVEQRLQRMRADWPPEEFEALLAQRHQTVDELRAELRAQLVQERLFHELVYPRVAVTEEEIRAELDAHPELLQEPEQVHAAQIVVKELDQAKEIRAKLRDGAKFADLARERSLSADAKDGGDLGWFPRGVMPPQFDAVAFSLGPGQISEVVTTDYGFHIFKLLERRPARKRDLAVGPGGGRAPAAARKAGAGPDRFRDPAPLEGGHPDQRGPGGAGRSPRVRPARLRRLTDEAFHPGRARRRSCSWSPLGARAELVDRVAAVVNNDVITLSEVEKRAAPELARVDQEATGPERAQKRSAAMKKPWTR